MPQFCKFNFVSSGLKSGWNSFNHIVGIMISFFSFFICLCSEKQTFNLSFPPTHLYHHRASIASVALTIVCVFCLLHFFSACRLGWCKLYRHVRIIFSSPRNSILRIPKSCKFAGQQTVLISKGKSLPKENFIKFSLSVTFFHCQNVYSHNINVYKAWWPSMESYLALKFLLNPLRRYTIF